MTDSECDTVVKIVLFSLMCLTLIFGVAFVVYHNAVIDPDADRTFVDKTGWTTNQGVFHKQVDCWGETIYTIGDKQVAYNHSWTAKDNQTVYTQNLQEGVVYSTYEKKYFFLFVPDNYYIIESDCGELN
jgi:hypothetical protein